MLTRELEQTLFEELDYADKPGLLVGDDIEWPNGRAIPDVSAALFLQNRPIAYFSRFSEIDSQKIKQLHKNVWSQSKAPLLFVTLPHEIRIYNGYEATPTRPGEKLNTEARLLQQLTGLTDYLTAQKQIRARLVEANHYQRIYLETGAFWNAPDGQKINYQNRADQQLVKGMKEMRRLLREAGLSNQVAYTLLGRSIFIRYLEDRGILTSEWVQLMTDGKASDYREALLNHTVTYLLFEGLSEHFKGDLFPIEAPERAVNEKHLKILLSFLNREDLKTGQLSFWPFNFEYIPIELISNIYDTFLDDQRASGAYYTPLLLADFILEETMGEEVIQPGMTVLDPACGSGIFLVGAFRRLIQAWRRTNGEPSLAKLSEILQNNIFGIDKEGEAVRIAAFSLYLEILNHLSNDQVRDDAFQFPSLQQKNLLTYDFFNKKVDKYFSNRKVDRVVGNMPWGKGSLTEKAEEWLTKKGYIVGGKQAAPAFMLRAPKFCKKDGEIALLAPTKSTVLVTSDPHQTFRKQFFSNYHARAIVNFSALRKELFSDAKNPTVAVFYAPTPPVYENKLIYGVPKPSPISQHLKAIVLDTTEIKFLNRQELLTYPELWKIALWGNSRDAALIERLKANPTLQKQLEKLGWQEPREGFQIGESKNKERDKLRKPTPRFLKDLPFLPTDDFQTFYIDVKPLPPTNAERVYLSGNKERYQAPLVLIHQSKCKAAYVDQNISFLASISVINGKSDQKALLKWLVCVINSPLTQYYQFLTSTRWAVERPNPLHKEYLDMPFLIPEKDDPKFVEVLSYFDRLIALKQDNVNDVFFNVKRKAELQKFEDAINKLVFELYNIHPVEQQLVADTLEYGIEFFNWSKRKNRKPQGAKPVQPPNTPMLKAYAEVFARAATSLLKTKNQTLNATVYKNGAPLTVVTFDAVNLEDQQPVRIVKKPDAMQSKLRELDDLLLAEKTPSMYIRRHVRIYDGQQISLVRPSEQRFWTQSQARIDAGAFLAELLS